MPMILLQVSFYAAWLLDKYFIDLILNCILSDLKYSDETSSRNKKVLSAVQWPEKVEVKF